MDDYKVAIIIGVLAFGFIGSILEMIFVNTIWNIKESFWNIE